MKRFVCIINGWNSINRDPKTATGMLAAGHRPERLSVNRSWRFGYPACLRRPVIQRSIR